LAEAAKKYDLLIKNVRVVRPDAKTVEDADIGITGGKFCKVHPGLSPGEAKAVYDGKGRLAFPGAVDAHMHTGIYAPLAEDAPSESRAAAQGGVTTSLNYFRTGQYYLNRGGPYAACFPEVLELSEGRFHVDYGYHLAPMDRAQISEIGDLIEKHGVSSFKIFMFYGSHGLHGRSDSQRDFLMIGEDAHERELEQGLVAHLRDFLLELGIGFAFVASQYRLEVGGSDFFIDLLFYHLKLRCFVLVDLKAKEFEPEFAGKMNFYLAAIDDSMRHPDDRPKYWSDHLQD